MVKENLFFLHWNLFFLLLIASFDSIDLTLFQNLFFHKVIHDNFILLSLTILLNNLSVLCNFCDLFLFLILTDLFLTFVTFMISLLNIWFMKGYWLPLKYFFLLGAWLFKISLKTDKNLSKSSQSFLVSLFERLFIKSFLKQSLEKILYYLYFILSLL